MGMNNKLKAIVALAVLGAASQAHAAIQPGSTGNGDLFLTVWDSVAQVSYTKDLGASLNAFIATGNTVQTTSFNFASDANWTSFLSQVGGVSNPGLQWNVGALDTTGGIGAGAQRFLSTSGNTLAQVKAQGNGNVQTGFSTVNNFFTAVNSTGTHATLTDGSSVNAAADLVDAYSGTWYGNNWNNKAQGWTSAGSLDTSLNFFYISPSSNAPASKATVTQFGDAVTGNMGTWTVTSAGVATYSVAAVSAVPVPAALWLLGSAMVGLVGVARRKVA